MPMFKKQYAIFLNRRYAPVYMHGDYSNKIVLDCLPNVIKQINRRRNDNFSNTAKKYYCKNYTIINWSKYRDTTLKVAPSI
jgi:hypothetical protein